MPRPKVELTFQGPFFTKDPARTVRGNMRRMVQGLAGEGEATIRGLFAAGEGSRLPIARLSPQHVAEHVVGRVRSLSGKPWQLTAVVSVNNSGLSRAEGISLMAAAARVEQQVHAFRGTTSAIRRSRAVLAANLTEGIE